MLTIADKGGKGGSPWLTKGGGGVQTFPNMADIICEQYLTRKHHDPLNA